MGMERINPLTSLASILNNYLINALHYATVAGPYIHYSAPAILAERTANFNQ